MPQNHILTIKAPTLELYLWFDSDRVLQPRASRKASSSPLCKFVHRRIELNLMQGHKVCNRRDLKPQAFTALGALGSRFRVNLHKLRVNPFHEPPIAAEGT